MKQNLLLRLTRTTRRRIRILSDTKQVRERIANADRFRDLVVAKVKVETCQGPPERLCNHPDTRSGGGGAAFAENLIIDDPCGDEFGCSVGEAVSDYDGADALGRVDEDGLVDDVRVGVVGRDDREGECAVFGQGSGEDMEGGEEEGRE